MDILKVNKKNLNIAVKALKNNGVIVYPTDTAYALGGKFQNPSVIRKIMKIKGRSDEKFTLVASSINQVKRFFHLHKEEQRLVKKYWPDPLSLVVSKKYAVRVPKNSIARFLALKTGCPLIATSANRTGSKTVYSVSGVIKEFSKNKIKPDVVLDGGRLNIKKTSTIVRVLKNGKKEIIRQGSVAL